MRAIATILCLAMIGMGVGCAAMSELVTPAEIDQKAVKYAEEAGTADANDFEGYPNLAKAEKLKVAVKSAHEVNTLAHQQAMEVDQLTYEQINGIVTANLTRARGREETLFGESGLLSMGLGMLGIGGLGGVLGLMRKRPGDWTKEEVQAAVDEVEVGKAVKEEQFEELVVGVGKFMKDLKENGHLTFLGDLKTQLAKAQSPTTEAAVATTKKKVNL